MMQIIDLRSGETVPSLDGGSVFVLGFFDGVHLGHRALLREARRLSEGRGVTAWTFRSLPKGDGRLLTTVEERLALLREAGADHAVLEEYGELRDLSGEAFIRTRIRDRFSPSAVLTGPNFRFGRDAACGAEMLPGLLPETAVRILPEEKDPASGEIISSSLIRSLVLDGRMTDAARLMGGGYRITGEVIHGAARGRRIGHPTVNQRISEGKVTPKHGVYSSLVLIGGETVFGVTNVGTRPTFHDGDGVTAETWLMDYEGDLYGRTVTTELFDYIRPERRFRTAVALNRRIETDAEEARRLLAARQGE